MEIEKAGNTYIVSDKDVEIRFSGVISSGESVTAFTRVYIKIPVRKLISTTKLNLLAPRSISELANRLNEMEKNDWGYIIQSACLKVIEDLLSPPIPEQLKIVEDTFPKFLVEQFILEQSPTLWFAPGGSGKSLLGLALGICTENGYDIFGGCEPTHTLYLDWETDKYEMDRRASLLVAGIADVYETDINQIKLPSYMRMYLPLIDSIEGLIETVYMHGFKFIIIDSVAPALANDLNSPSETTKFFSAIRKLNAEGVTTLLITHVSKEAKKTGAGSPFGSVFFENFPRLTWELKSEYDEQRTAFNFGIFCRKSNVGKLESRGFSLAFKDKKIEISYIDPDDVKFDEKRTLNEMIVSLLTDKEMSPKEIASELGVAPQLVWNALSTLNKKGVIKNVGYGRWRKNEDSEI